MVENVSGKVWKRGGANRSNYRHVYYICIFRNSYLYHPTHVADNRLLAALICLYAQKFIHQRFRSTALATYVGNMSTVCISPTSKGAFGGEFFVGIIPRTKPVERLQQNSLAGYAAERSPCEIKAAERWQ